LDLTGIIISLESHCQGSLFRKKPSNFAPVQNTYIHIVPEGVTGIRLSNYAAGIFPGLATRSGLKKAIKRREVLVGGQIATTATMLFAGNEIEWNKPDYVPRKLYDVELEVVYEDDYLAVVSKPAGIVVSGNRPDTLEHGLPAHLARSSQEDALPVFRAIHRLDSATSGLVIIAKTSHARVTLGNMMEQKEIAKTYQAVVIGETPASGFFNDPVQGKEAITRFERMETVSSLVSGRLSLLNLYPETGRTHQIRIHLANAGFPILGDKLHGDPGFLLRGKGLFLCAVKAEFRHPVTGKPLKISIAPPPKFQKFMDGEKKRWIKYALNNSPGERGTPGE
jgi:23S rRNA pseudouridine1911/1915/1917 synthase